MTQFSQFNQSLNEDILKVSHKILESSTSEHKSELIKLLRGDTLDDGQIGKMYAIVKSHLVDELLMQAANNMEAPTAYELLKNVFSNSKGSFDEKFQGLTELANNGLLPTSVMDGESVKDIISELSVKNTFTIDFTHRLFNEKPMGDVMGSKARATGRGELMLLTLIKKAKKAKIGDVEIGSSSYEVKTSVSPGKAPGILRKYTGKEISNDGLHSIMEYFGIDKNKMKNWKFNKTGFKNINAALTKDSRSSKEFEKMFTEAINDTFPTLQIKKSDTQKIFKGNTVSLQGFIEMLAGFTYEVYRKEKKWNYLTLMLGNGKKIEIKTYDNNKSFEAAVKSGTVHFGIDHSHTTPYYTLTIG